MNNIQIEKLLADLLAKTKPAAPLADGGPAGDTRRSRRGFGRASRTSPASKNVSSTTTLRRALGSGGAMCASCGGIRRASPRCGIGSVAWLGVSVRAQGADWRPGTTTLGALGRWRARLHVASKRQPRKRNVSSAARSSRSS
jgi:hypothetical protein